tara:strand:+ start:348 stop:812 length:465 start_codon:yes stop_codon:yes gene_type:complete
MRSGAIIYPILSNYANLTALVNANSIFAVRAQQPTTAPYIVYREVSSVPTNTNGPDASAATGDPRVSQRSILDVIRVQISCFDTDYVNVENIAFQVRMALDREWGTTTAPYDTVVSLDSAIYDNCVDDYDNKYGENGIYIKNLDFFLRVNRLDI